MIVFKYFPKIEYGLDQATNIMVRAKIRDVIKSSSYVFYPYTVKDGEKPEVISHKYYGSMDYTWLVFYANDIFDPIFDWVLDSDDFDKFIVSKYGSIDAANLLIHHYELTPGGLIIDHDTYFNPDVGDSRKRIVTALEYEDLTNEAKRTVKIIDARYRDQIVNELKALFI